MCEAVLCEQLQDLKHKHEAAKKAAREAKKMEKNALRKRTRLIKVPLCLCVSAGRTFTCRTLCVLMFMNGRLPKVVKGRSATPPRCEEQGS